MMPYFYEHTNGEIIKKPQIVVKMAGGPDEYFNSPFVKRWWFQAEIELEPPERNE